MSAPPSSARISAVLFDKDGTLLDYWKSWVAINRAAADLAARGDAAVAAHLLSVGGADPVTGFVAPDSLLAAASAREIASAWVAAGSPFTTDVLGDELDALFHRSVDTVVPVTDLAALFARLKARGLKLGIASSDSEAAILATAERFKLTASLDFIAGYDSGFGRKPSGGMVLGFCAAVGVRPHQTAVVGDNVHDMAMAADAGAGLRIGVLTGTGTRASLVEMADVCVDSIDQLEALLGG